MSSRPSKIKVGPHVYTIRWTKSEWEAEKRLAKKDVKTCNAVTLVYANKIYMNSWSVSLTHQKVFLIHELMHAMYGMLGWSSDEYGWSGDELDKSVFEEHTIRILSPQFLQILTENPELVEWLTND